ncbi:hypothetical protein B0T16DRAFT_409602 [Cercophora newfieldiana]|uniref:Uncharacterized protein n=1 Tax=Cercophora newfieldiana TaxID=92897 RepID=A0AA39YAZ1_9PEZI|nr:hypothetical protein B0T16DRAFT_409602 [Cercophora newfieldiana]
MSQLQNLDNRKRATCRYISGISDETVISCWATSTCGTIDNHVGCCLDGESQCYVATTCFDVRDHDLDRCTYLSPGIRCCTSSLWKYCATMTYGDATSNTIIRCATDRIDRVIYNTPILTPIFGGYTSTKVSEMQSSWTVPSSPLMTIMLNPTRITRDPSAETPPSSTSSITVLDAPSHSPSTHGFSLPFDQPSSSRTATIVGGVVGGVALLSGLLLFLFCRYKRQPKASEARIQHRKLPTSSPHNTPAPDLPPFNPYSPLQRSSSQANDSFSDVSSERTTSHLTPGPSSVSERSSIGQLPSPVYSTALSVPRLQCSPAPVSEPSLCDSDDGEVREPSPVETLDDVSSVGSSREGDIWK